MKAVNIAWDCGDTGADPKTLPKQIKIPKDITDKEEMSEYVTQKTGFAHQGFELAYDVKRVHFSHDKDFAKFALDVSFVDENGTGVNLASRVSLDEWKEDIEFSARAEFIEWLDSNSIYGSGDLEERFLGEFWYDVPQMLLDEVKHTAWYEYGFRVDEDSVIAAIDNAMEAEMANISTNALFEKYGETISCGTLVPIEFTRLNNPPVIYELYDKQNKSLCINDEMCVIVGKDAKNVELLGSKGKFSLTLDEAATAGVKVDKVRELTKTTKDKSAER